MLRVVNLDVWLFEPRQDVHETFTLKLKVMYSYHICKSYIIFLLIYVKCCYSTKSGKLAYCNSRKVDFSALNDTQADNSNTKL